MIFEIDADMVYSRGCMAKRKFFKSFSTQYMVIRPSKPLYFRLSGEEICAVIDDTDNLNSFFSPSETRNPLFKLYSRESECRNFSSQKEYEENVPQQFIGLEFEEFRSESFWKEEDILPAWEELLDQYDDLMIDRDQAYAHGYKYPQDYFEDDIPAFEEFKRRYIQSRNFQVIEDALSIGFPRSNDEDLTFVGANGGWASGVWYPDDFLLDGFENIRSIKIVSPNAKTKKATSLSQIKKIATTEALADWGGEEELAESIDLIRDDLFGAVEQTSESIFYGCLSELFWPCIAGFLVAYVIGKWLF